MAHTYIKILKQLERKHEPLWRTIREQKIIQTSWVKHLRWGFNMSARQLGKRMGISQQAALDIEHRELNGNITIATLRRAAAAFDMDLFYMFTPKKGMPTEHVLQAMIEKRALELAREIVGRAANTMLLEDQATEQKATQEDIKEMADELVRKLHGSLWE